MGWIGLHVGAHHSPHVTLAWWRKEDRHQDEKALIMYTNVLNSRTFNRPIPVQVVGQSNFGGPERKLPVHVLDAANLVFIRRAFKILDKRPNYVPHVTCEKWTEPPNHYVFTHIGLHTVRPGRGIWEHQYHELRLRVGNYDHVLPHG